MACSEARKKLPAVRRKHVLTRYLSLVGTRLSRDGKRSVCMRRSFEVWVKDASLLIPKHFIQAEVFCPCVLVALEVDAAFGPDSSLSFPEGLSVAQRGVVGLGRCVLVEADFRTSGHR